ncbi:endonuclease [Mycoplasma seminis]|uniref:Endonuclease n=1 Tax=Mycoplasma seminis TaxID=512749 RepID=A0ABY9HA87_9MOLU|nr:endonuclease [Mycoplasma seminis]WLP85156.1 endonuclease [Mycoplasma seminis]
MKKFKTLLLSLAGASALALPIAAVSCSQETEASVKEKMEKTTVKATLAQGVDKANTLASTIQASQITLDGFDKKIFKVTMGTLAGNDTTGILTIPYEIQSIKFANVKASKSVQIDGFKTTPAATEQPGDGKENKQPAPDKKISTDSGTEKVKSGETKVINPNDDDKTPQDDELKDTALKTGNAIFEVIPNAINDEVINYLKDSKNKNIIYFNRESKNIGTKRKGGIEFLKLIEKAKGSNIRPVNTKETTFTTKKGDVYPNSNLEFEFKQDSSELIIKYKLAIETTKDKYKYLDKVYTTKLKLEVSKEAPKTTPADGGKIELPKVNTTLAYKYQYVYDDKNNYYKDAEGKSGEELVKALLNIQKSHLGGIKPGQDGYGKNGLVKIYNSNAFKDFYYEKDGTLLDVYSENPSAKDPYTYKVYQYKDNANDEGEGTNREHIVPQSWFGGKKAWEIERNDGNHVFPTDIVVNRIRDNNPHDNVVSNIEWTSKNGSKLGTNNIGTTAFEPIDAFKGDIARAYLYFTVTYNDVDLQRGTGSIFKPAFPYIQSHYLNTYINWDAKDPVDPFDVTRNNETAKIQEIRNPFIDYPNLYENIFGDNPKPFHNLGTLIEAKPLS